MSDKQKKSRPSIGGQALIEGVMMNGPEGVVLSVRNEDGEIVTYKGDVLVNGDGNIETSLEPLIDTDFMKDLFEASGLIDYKNLREFYDARQIPYNPDGKNRDKLGKFATVADLINADWQLPWYEPQRPGGAYLVDTAPVNTIIFCCCLLEMCYISNKVVHSEAAM